MKTATFRPESLMCMVCGMMLMGFLYYYTTRNIEKHYPILSVDSVLIGSGSSGYKFVPAFSFLSSFLFFSLLHPFVVVVVLLWLCRCGCVVVMGIYTSPILITILNVIMS
jgi:hypothetical protein